ncbi:MAG: hypothetical protein HOK35_05410 [Cytophagia bacterium]|nr:hypothetical protein [Cytophagia bacterium]
MRKLIRISLLVIIILTFHSCNNSTSPSNDDFGSFFPLSVGNYWTYNSSDSERDNWTQTVIGTLDGYNDVFIIEAPADEQIVNTYYKWQNDGLYIYGFDNPDDSDPPYMMQVPYLELPEVLSLGVIFNDTESSYKEVTGKDVLVVTDVGEFESVEITLYFNSGHLIKQYYVDGIGLILFQHFEGEDDFIPSSFGELIDYNIN